ncbi:integral membrane sensor signal transduction histidine kinase [Desulfotomaculum nigrificans CO-1-SRB]|uniref:histidine kinase n=1 Tax=Desulfotomaculum nigrificans (strain DSM 14880 / VKM B-2319 / CO-1-SRB) TaxID=868595 RepID=F6B8Z5_DESCC|nr:HAMP domain-containing sensor histidine kinase [Desulfotomaculum nigrificans]AEF93646.1 integral membrane sensor signal transduction histidine kinase [Desulfotomaculum nigrificans CO-1-SRB]
MMQKVSNRIKSFFIPNSLLVQLLSRTLLILAVLLVLIGLLQYVFMREVIYRNKADSLRSQVMSMPHFWEPRPDVGDVNNRPPRIFIPDANLAFIDLDGNFTILSNGRNDINPPKLDTQEYFAVLNQRPHLNYKVIKESDQPEQLLVLQPVFEHPGQVVGVLQISTLTEPLRELLIRQLLTFLFLSLIAMLIGLVGFLPILRKTLVPLFNMVDTAEQIDAGNLAKRFPTQQGQMEIDRLAESFNGMLERLEASFAAERETKEQMRRFIADASHELRTPLTSIHGFLEVLLRGAVNQPDQLHKALKSMHGESERLNKLVHDLLLLAKLDRTPHIELTEGLLNTVIRDMEPQLRILSGNRKLSIEMEPNLKCKYDTDKIKQVILNLFHNAVQHTDPDEGQIKISLVRKNNGVALSVQDNGPGISEDHLNRVFDRFYRIDSSRTRKYGGSGLGLAISKSIVDAHGGTISVTSQVGKGSTFNIWLPG